MSETRKRRKIAPWNKGKKWSQSREARINRINVNHPILISPDGEEVQVTTVRLMAEDYDLQYSGIQSLISGRCQYYKGWTLKGTEYISRGHTISQRKRPEGFPQVISPDGDTYRVEILREFCRNHNLSVGNMSQLVNGKKQQYKGWTVSPPSNMEKSIGKSRR